MNQRKIKGWICIHDNGEIDHDFRWHDDWIGDPEIINGTMGCGYWECVQCGEQEEVNFSDVLV